MGKDKGYILIYRDIQDNVIWKSEPFSKGQAWVDLLLMANYKEKSLLMGNKSIIADRGSVITSELKLAERWNWSRKKTRAFLKLLEDLQMIDKKSLPQGTTVLIKNYDIYQKRDTTEDTTSNLINKGIEACEGTTEDTTKGTTEDTTKGTQTNKDINKSKIKDKRRDIIRHKYGEYQNVLLSDVELEKLKSEYPSMWNVKLEALSEYLMTSGKTYKSHYATIRAWIRKDIKEGGRSNVSEDNSSGDKGKTFNVEALL